MKKYSLSVLFVISMLLDFLLVITYNLIYLHSSPCRYNITGLSVESAIKDQPTLVYSILIRLFFHHYLIFHFPRPFSRLIWAGFGSLPSVIFLYLFWKKLARALKEIRKLNDPNQPCPFFIHEWISKQWSICSFYSSSPTPVPCSFSLSNCHLACIRCVCVFVLMTWCCGMLLCYTVLL